MPLNGVLRSAFTAALGWVQLAAGLLAWLTGALQAAWRLCPKSLRAEAPRQALPEPWESCPELRLYRGEGNDGGCGLLTVCTDPHSFQVHLPHLARHSDYFAALSRSHMRETSRGHLDLPHVPSSTFRAVLEWVFFGRFFLEEEDLLPAFQVGSYLALPGFLDRCGVALRTFLGPQNCLSFLHMAESLACPELRAEVCRYLSDHLLELAPTTTGRLDPHLREELIQMRLEGPPSLCILRKENVVAPQTGDLPRGLFRRPLPPEEGAWHCFAQLPFQAEKWSFSVAPLLNYLFLSGGFREKKGVRGFAFRQAAFRYNPLTRAWTPIAAPQKRRRHFSMVASGGHLFAVGGRNLGSLLGPDSSPCLYGTVERYDPWADHWALASPLPLGDIPLAVAFSHDLPLCAPHPGSLVALGSLHGTGEKLLLRYDVQRRRHFSLVASGGHLFAVGGWHLGSLLGPDSSTCLYGAVERYDPWADHWALVSPLPLAETPLAVSLSHDLPLCAPHPGSLVALGSLRGTGEKLLLRYDVQADSWQELLPTLTRADADLPGLYFLGGTDPLFVLGGNVRCNAVTSFSLSRREWGPVLALPKCGLAGQGLALDNGTLFMASPDAGAILEVDLEGLRCRLLPPPPFPLSYEALFLLRFPASRPAEGEEPGGSGDPNT